MFACVHLHACVGVGRKVGVGVLVVAEDNMQGSAFPFHHVGRGYQTLVSHLGDRYIYTLNYLTEPSCWSLAYFC